MIFQQQFSHFRLDFVGINPKMWRKANKEFHFWLNTFFVDAEMDGGLAHDILGNDQFEDENESPGTEGCEDSSSYGHNHNPSFTEVFPFLRFYIDLIMTRLHSY